MIRRLSHQEIDKRWYDAQLDRCANAIWYARSAVLDTASPGWQLLVDDAHEAMMPLTWRSRWGFQYLFQPFGLQYLGVFASRRLDTPLCARFLQAIPKEFALVDICMGPGVFLERIPEVSLRTTLCMRFPGQAEVHQDSYSKGHVRNLRTSIPAHVQWSDTVAPEEFMELFRRTTSRRFGGLKQQDAVVLRGLLDLAGREGSLRWAAYRGPEGVLAAMAFLEWRGRNILFKSAVSEEAHAFRAGFHLVDRYIATHAGSPDVLDFAGSEDPAVARFYKGFGASELTYFRVFINRLPWPLRRLK